MQFGTMFSLCTLSLEGGRDELDTHALNNEQTMTSRRPQSQGDREKMRAETPGFHMHTAALWTQVRNEGFLAKSDPRFLFQFHNTLLQCRCVTVQVCLSSVIGKCVTGQVGPWPNILFKCVWEREFMFRDAVSEDGISLKIFGKTVYKSLLPVRKQW